MHQKVPPVRQCIAGMPNVLRRLCCGSDSPDSPDSPDRTPQPPVRRAYHIDSSFRQRNQKTQPVPQSAHEQRSTGQSGPNRGLPEPLIPKNVSRILRGSPDQLIGVHEPRPEVSHGSTDHQLRAPVEALAATIPDITETDETAVRVTETREARVREEVTQPLWLDTDIGTQQNATATEDFADQEESYRAAKSDSGHKRHLSPEEETSVDGASSPHKKRVRSHDRRPSNVSVVRTPAPAEDGTTSEHEAVEVLVHAHGEHDDDETNTTASEPFNRDDSASAVFSGPGQGSLAPSPPSSAHGSQPDEQQDVFPRAIALKACIRFDSSEHLTFGVEKFVILDFVWFAVPSYDELERTKENSLKLLFKENDLQQHESYYRYGHFRLLGSKRRLPYVALDDERSLRDQAVKACCGFIRDHTYEPFELEVTWNYSSRTSASQQPEASSMMMRDLSSKVRLNFEGRKYISKSDLSWARAKEVIEHNIDADMVLGKRTATERTAFAEKIALAAPLLHLACIRAGITLNHLKHLMTCLRQKEDGHQCHDQCRGNSVFDDNNPPGEHHYCTNDYGVCAENMGKLSAVQPVFFAHNFRPEVQFHQLGDNDVVPISYDPDANGKHVLGFGAGGIVHRVRIDPAHHYFSGNRDAPFALKIFHNRTETSQDFDKEHKMLQELAKFPHEHIAGHIASWTRGQGDFFILYPLARCNLRKFMQETERPELSADVVKWFLRQLQGLADAIRNIHFLGGPSFNTSPGADLFRSERFTAFHHDIKPENILVFQPEEDADVVLTSSTFKISDFGASKFGKLGAEGESSAVSKSHGTATYRGPDIVMSERGASRPFDLWATGCVFLELLSWLFYPFKEAIVDFSSERAKDSGQYQDIADDQFWCRVETPRPSAAASSARPTYLKPQPKGSVAHRPPVLVALRPAVERRLQHLERHHCKNRRAFQDVLKIIRSLLEPDIGKRLNADALLGSLDPVVKQAKADLEVKPDMYTRPHSPSQSPPPKVAMIAVDNKSLGPLDRRRSTQSLNEIQEISKSSASLLDSVSNYGTGPHLSDERHANDHEQEGGLLFGLRDKQVAEPPIVPYSREDITGPLNSPSLMDLSAPEKPEVSDEQDDSRTQDGTSN